MAKVESQVAPPAVPDGCSLADWAEAALLIEDRKHFSRSMLRQRLANTSFIEGDELDAQLDLLLGEVARRVRIAPEVYPFEETAIGLSRRRDVEQALYEFLLWLSVSPRYREENRFSEIDALFDGIVQCALIAYLGPGARGVRFAFPSKDGRPPGFEQAVQWLAELLNLTTGKLIPRPKVKDGGVDVVAWRPFADGRAGFVVVLAQCTVQLDWVGKSKDIVVGKWLGWIDFGLSPLTALAVPFAVPVSFDRWDELRRTVNVVLDRLRLCELVDPARLDVLKEIKEWASSERVQLGVP